MESQIVKLLCFYEVEVCHIRFIGHGIYNEVKDPFGVLYSINPKYLCYCLVKTVFILVTSIITGKY